MSDHVSPQPARLQGSLDDTQIRPTVLSGPGASLWEIENGEGPRTVQDPGALNGTSPFGRHLRGGDRGMKATRPRGTTRAATPFLHRDLAIGSVRAQLDASLRIQGVGMT